MKRPTGVTILAIIALIIGVLYVLLALLGLAGEALEASNIPTTASAYSAGQLAYAAISDAILGILSLLFGIGAFAVKRWGWISGVIALVLYGVRAILDVVMQGFATGRIIISAITIVIVLLLLWYLFRPKVRAAFARAA